MILAGMHESIALRASRSAIGHSLKNRAAAIANLNY